MRAPIGGRNIVLLNGGGGREGREGREEREERQGREGQEGREERKGCGHLLEAVILYYLLLNRGGGRDGWEGREERKGCGTYCIVGCNIA